jgi:hypothetical protein
VIYFAPRCRKMVEGAPARNTGSTKIKQSCSSGKRQALSRADAFKAGQRLAIEALAREAERQWLHNEVVSVRVEEDLGG